MFFAFVVMALGAGEGGALLTGGCIVTRPGPGAAAGVVGATDGATGVGCVTGRPGFLPCLIALFTSRLRASLTAAPVKSSNAIPCAFSFLLMSE